MPFSNRSAAPEYQPVSKTRSPAVARVRLTVLVITDLQGYPRSTIFMSFESQYVTSY